MVVPNNQENSDKLITSSELGQLPSSIETSINNAELLHERVKVQALQEVTEGQGANVRIILDKMHRTYTPPGQENIVVDESSPLYDNIGEVQEFEHPKTLLLGSVEFASTTKINMYHIQGYDQDGTPRFDDVDEITKFNVTNPEIRTTPMVLI